MPIHARQVRKRKVLVTGRAGLPLLLEMRSEAIVMKDVATTRLRDLVVRKFDECFKRILRKNKRMTSRNMLNLKT